MTQTESDLRSGEIQYVVNCALMYHDKMAFLATSTLVVAGPQVTRRSSKSLQKRHYLPSGASLSGSAAARLDASEISKDRKNHDTYIILGPMDFFKFRVVAVTKTMTQHRRHQHNFFLSIIIERFSVFVRRPGERNRWQWWVCFYILVVFIITIFFHRWHQFIGWKWWQRGRKLGIDVSVSSEYRGYNQPHKILTVSHKYIEEPMRFSQSWAQLLSSKKSLLEDWAVTVLCSHSIHCTTDGSSDASPQWHTMVCRLQTVMCCNIDTCFQICFTSAAHQNAPAASPNSELGMTGQPSGRFPYHGSAFLIQTNVRYCSRWIWTLSHLHAIHVVCTDFCQETWRGETAECIRVKSLKKKSGILRFLVRSR